MGKYKKCLALATVIALSLILLLTGCTAKDTTTTTTSTLTTPSSTTTSTNPFTQEQLKQILLDSKTATQAAGNYRLNMDLSSVMNIDNGLKTSSMTMNAEMAFNVSQNRLFMAADLTSSATGMETQTQSINIYALTDYVYLNAVVPGMGEQWVKVPATEEVLKSFSINMMQEEMGLLDNPASVEYAGEATLKGIDCIVLDITPNVEYLRTYAEEQGTDSFKINWDKIQDISSIYKTLNYKIWIAKDTKYLHKMVITSLLSFKDDFAELEGIDFNTADIDADVNMEMFDYNTSISIELPAAAENAIELSPEMLMGE